MQSAAVQSFEQWRAAARQYLARDIQPGEVIWSDSRSSALFATPMAEPDESPQSCGAGEPRVSNARDHADRAGDTLTIPRELRSLLQYLACYRDPGRWELMYRLSWRVLHGQRELLDNEADPDVRTAHLWQKAIRHDVHKMHAFVRFHEVSTDAGLRYVAWFEPQHEILRVAAPFFEKRFRNMQWMIATPDGAASWNGHELQFVDSPPRSALPREDATHPLWRTYYRNICNLARINPDVMRQHMPRHYWKHLPEAQEIGALMANGRKVTRQAIDSLPRPDNLQMPRGVSRSLEGLEAAGADPDSPLTCHRCDLWRHATQAVLGEGPKDARIMLVGEQPGDEEDLKGRPFVGPAGRLLDQILENAGLPRNSLYVTNAVKHFKWEPRGKRRLHKRPDQQEVRACNGWLQGEIAAVAPRVIVALGATAIRAVTGLTISVEQARREPQTLSAQTTVVCTYHPSALLRAEDDRREQLSQALEADLKTAARLAG